jgi:hypothetical protein
MQFMANGMANRVGPTFHEQAFAMYMNRASEVGWLILRLLPYLQIQENGFGIDWHRKCAVLDDSFRYMVHGLSNLGKKIGDAFITLVDERFSFGRSLSYFEPDGSA